MRHIYNIILQIADTLKKTFREDKHLDFGKVLRIFAKSEIFHKKTYQPTHYERLSHHTFRTTVMPAEYEFGTRSATTQSGTTSSARCARNNMVFRDI